MKNTEIALTFGRFNNIRKGHLDFIAETLNNYEKLVILVLNNEIAHENSKRNEYLEFYRMCDENHKRNIYSTEERIENLKRIFEKSKNVCIKESYRPELSIDDFNSIFPNNKYILVFPTSKQMKKFDRERNKIFSEILKRKIKLINIKKFTHSSDIKEGTDV